LDLESNSWRAQSPPCWDGAASSAASASEHRFSTGQRRTTTVHVGRGLIDDPCALGLIPDESAASPIYVLTDPTVDRLYGNGFITALRAGARSVVRLVMPEGEACKSLGYYVRLVERILESGVDEQSVLVSLGGGTVCNICGFVASTLHRGIRLAHVPTTLMAQCDAAIGHKQAVNGSRGKNLIGAYYAPTTIVADIDVLRTLDDRLVADGLSEVLKHALAQDASYLRMLQTYTGDPRDPGFLLAVVRRNIELKCELMRTDPQERCEAMVLQYGHAVAHALEHVSGHALSHGQSVALGMMTSARVACLLGLGDENLVEVHRALITRYGLPTRIPTEVATSDVIDAMRWDKRRLQSSIRMALVASPGRIWRNDCNPAIPVAASTLARALEHMRERRPS
jgi:3-dehydroquinate synthase